MNPETLLASEAAAVVGALPEVHMLNSSCVKVAEYDHEDGDAILTFPDGNQYTYKELPYDVYRALVGAPSPGRYYNEHIKGQYA